jgi:hypothetical protein
MVLVLLYVCCVAVAVTAALLAAASVQLHRLTGLPLLLV